MSHHGHGEHGHCHGGHSPGRHSPGRHSPGRHSPGGHSPHGGYQQGGYQQPYQQPGGYPPQQPGYYPPQQPGGYPPQQYPQGGQYPCAPQQQHQPRREFQIVSEMNRKVVDIQGANAAEHTKVIMYTPHGTSKNQLWYVDHQGIIRSALNDMVFFHEEQGHALKMVHYTGDPRHTWRISGNQIINGSGSCLDIKGASQSESAELCAYHYKGSNNQHWHINYVN